MNHHQKCVVPDCHELRTRLGRYCRPHKRRLAQYGHPRGRPLSRTHVDLAGLSQEIEAQLAANADHPGLSRAVRELQQRLDEAAAQAQEGVTLRGATPYWAKLAAHGVAPQAILARVVAVAVLDHENQHLFPDQRTVEFAIAHAVFGLAPVGRHPPGARVLASAGRRMVNDYVGLIVTTAAALKAARADARQRDADMSADMRPAPINSSF